LKELTAEIETFDDAIRILGAPDIDRKQGVTEISKYSETKPQEVKSFREVVYQDFSETAEIHMQDTEQGKVFIWFSGKYIGDKA
jgi:hypothetical protein